MDSTPSLKISAVILTLNEEETVANAIKSLGWCDEIFVVDSESSDATCDIAERMGASVYKHRQDGVFLISEQRNWAVKNLPVKGDWILFLDADEESTEEFKNDVIISLSDSQHQAFYAAPAFIYYDKWIKHTSGYPNWHPRIVKRDSAVSFVGGVWEEFSDKKLAGFIPAPYLHETNAKGFEDWLMKHVRYAKWESARITNQNGSSNSADRRGLLRAIRYRLGGLRKFASIFYYLIIRRGFLDGPEGRSYLRRMFVYELLIDEFSLEHNEKDKRRSAND